MTTTTTVSWTRDRRVWRERCVARRAAVRRETRGSARIGRRARSIPSTSTPRSARSCRRTRTRRRWYRAFFAYRRRCGCCARFTTPSCNRWRRRRPPTGSRRRRRGRRRRRPPSSSRRRRRRHRYRHRYRRRAASASRIRVTPRAVCAFTPTRRATSRRVAATTRAPSTAIVASTSTRVVHRWIKRRTRERARGLVLALERGRARDDAETTRRCEYRIQNTEYKSIDRRTAENTPPTRARAR